MSAVVLLSNQGKPETRWQWATTDDKVWLPEIYPLGYLNLDMSRSSLPRSRRETDWPSSCPSSSHPHPWLIPSVS